MPRTYDPNTPEGRRIARSHAALYRRDHPRTSDSDGYFRGFLFGVAILAILFLATVGLMTVLAHVK